MNEELLKRMAALREADRFTDFEIIYSNGQCKQRVHRLVLSMHSEVFDKACDGRFKEAQEHKLDLSEYGEVQIDRLITYMYTLNYSGGHIKTEAGDNVKSTQIDVHMYILADKYDLKSLKDLALNKLEADVSNWDVELIKKDYDMVTAAITTAYGASVATSRVRSVLVRKLVEVDIFASSSSAKSALLKLIDELPAFGKALVTEAAKQKHRSLGGMKLYHCPSCSIRFMVDMTTTTSRWYCPNCERSMLGSKWAVHLVNT